MPDDSRPDELEGWGLRSGRAALVGGGFFLLIAACVVGALFFYWGSGSPHVNVTPAARFPQPELNARLDRDPTWSFAPPDPAEHEPDQAVRSAMAELAAKGDAGYQPLRGAP